MNKLIYVLLLSGAMIGEDNFRPETLRIAEARYGKLNPDYSWDNKSAWLREFPFHLYNIKILHSVYVNSDIYIPLTNVMNELAATGLLSEIKTLNGCYSPRSVAGFTRPSIHAYALGCDFNAFIPGGARFSDEFVKVWKRHGFCWGGKFKRKADPMHFSYAWECRPKPFLFEYFNFDTEFGMETE